MREIKFKCWDKVDKQMFHNLVNFGSESINDFFKEKQYIFLQYTGLKDKNGKEIYEGDMVRIQYVDNNFNDVDKVEKVFLTRRTGDYYIYEYMSNELEVIGNIYENPELLKEE